MIAGASRHEVSLVQSALDARTVSELLLVLIADKRMIAIPTLEGAFSRRVSEVGVSDGTLKSANM